MYKGGKSILQGLCLYSRQNIDSFSYRQSRNFANWYCLPAHVLAVKCDSSQLRPLQRRLYSKASPNIWEFDVQPFGRLTVKTGALASVFVKPIDPQVHPMQNKAFVKVTPVDDGTDDAVLTCTEEDSHIQLVAEHIKPNIDKKLFACDIQLPIKYGGYCMVIIMILKVFLNIRSFHFGNTNALKVKGATL